MIDPHPLFLPVDRYLHPLLPEIWFGVVLFTLVMYVALDGFDFGVGILYATRADETERETLLAAFGPVWDANEVWLVAFGTVLLAAFPPVYSRLLSDHYLLAIAIVLALLFRGVAPELREQREEERWQRACDRSFVFGSLASPFLLGTLVGSWAFGTGTLSLPSLLTGVAVVSLSITAGGAYLSAKTDGALRAGMVRYGLFATLAYLGSAVVLLAVLVVGHADVRASILAPSGLAVVTATVVVGLTGFVLAARGRYRAWFASTALLATLLVTLVAVVLYPSVYPAAGLTVRDAVVSPLALNLVTVIGLPVLALVLWYFKYLYSVFSGPVDSDGYSA